MRMKQSSEFEFEGDEMSYDEVKQLWTAVESAGEKCVVTISQTSYDERPYGNYTHTTITVEVT